MTVRHFTILAPTHKLAMEYLACRLPYLLHTMKKIYFGFVRKMILDICSLPFASCFRVLDRDTVLCYLCFFASRWQILEIRYPITIMNMSRYMFLL